MIGEEVKFTLIDNYRVDKVEVIYENSSEENIARR